MADQDRPHLLAEGVQLGKRNLACATPACGWPSSVPPDKCPTARALPIASAATRNFPCPPRSRLPQTLARRNEIPVGILSGRDEVDELGGWLNSLPFRGSDHHERQAIDIRSAIPAMAVKNAIARLLVSAGL
jgi:hypothetical protein